MSAPQVPSADENHPRMRRVDLSSDNLTSSQRKMIDSYNLKQYQKFNQKYGYRNTLMAAGILGVVFSVYGYTVYQMSKDKDLIAEMEKEVMEFDEKK